MRAHRKLWIAAGASAGLLGLLVAVGSSVRMVPVDSPPSELPPGKEVAGIVTVVLVVVLLVVVMAVVGVKFFDLSGRREQEAEGLEATISAALRRDVGYLPVIAVAHPSSSKGSPVIIEVTGRVPTPGLRDAVLDVVEREMSRLRPHHRVEDRLEVAAAAVSGA